MKSYGEFAYIYDELMDSFNYKDWFTYINKIFKKENVEVVDILEMACGTGSMTKELVENNYRVTCFDKSLDMLTVAEQKLRPYKNVNILQQDMINFNINKKFDSILSICDSLNYLTNKSDLKESFSRVYKHLEEGGLFIFDLNSKYKLKEIIGNNIFIEEREDIFYTWENYYSEDNICYFYLNFFLKRGASYKRFIEEHSQKAYDTLEVSQLLKKVGFSKIKVYDAFTFSEARKDSERLNFVVRK